MKKGYKLFLASMVMVGSIFFSHKILAAENDFGRCECYSSFGGKVLTRDDVILKECKDYEGLQAKNGKTVKAGGDLIQSCIFSEKKNYCCCRNDRDCGFFSTIDGTTKDICNAKFFPNQPALGDSAYVAKIAPAGNANDVCDFGGISVQKVNYCCCRQTAAGMNCQNQNNYIDNKTCGDSNFSDETKLPSGSYVVKNIPENVDQTTYVCAQFNTKNYCCCTGDKCEKLTGGNDSSYSSILSTCQTQNGKTAEVRSIQSDGTCSTLSSLKGKVDTGDAFAEVRNKAADLNQLSVSSPQEFIGQIIKVLLSFIGSITLILYIYAGVNWMLDRGSGERVKKSKDIIVWTTLGVFMMLASYILIQYIFKIF